MSLNADNFRKPVIVIYIASSGLHSPWNPGSMIYLYFCFLPNKLTLKLLQMFNHLSFMNIFEMIRLHLGIVSLLSQYCPGGHHRQSSSASPIWAGL